MEIRSQDMFMKNPQKTRNIENDRSAFWRGFVGGVRQNRSLRDKCGVRRAAFFEKGGHSGKMSLFIVSLFLCFYSVGADGPRSSGIHRAPVRLSRNFLSKTVPLRHK